MAEASALKGDLAASGTAAVKPATNRWYVLAILLLIYIFGAVDRSVVSVIAEPLKNEFSLSDAQIGALGGLAYSLTFGLFVLPMGWLIDRIDRRLLLSGMVAIWSVLTALGSVATSYVVLFTARMGVGAAEAASSPASFSLIGDYFSPKERSTAVGIYYAGAPGGQLVIFLLGGWILLYFDWRAVFLVAAVPGILLAALLFFTCREPVRGGLEPQSVAPVAAERGPSVREVLRNVVFTPTLRNAMLANMICTGVGSTLIIWLTSFFSRIHGLPVSQAAVWVGLGYGLPMTLSSLIIGPIADRYSGGNPARLALIPAVTSALGLGAGCAMALWDDAFGALMWLVAFSTLGGLYTGPSYSLVLNLAPANTRGSTMAAAKLLVILIGSGVFPILAGLVSDAVGGPRSIIGAVLATVALLAPASIFFVITALSCRKERRDVAQALS